ncbi:MAG: class I SAM-dependent methyltransferase [Deltaproteobacteria bacterium]|nr:class I SAM-dependent methyltransferase [Deltaproteobacteria bacterium]
MEDKSAQDGITLHNKQAQLFRNRYLIFNKDPYLSTFTYGRKKIDEILYKYLVKYSPPREVLDIGCGTGYTLKALKAQGYHCTGVDGAEEMVKIAIQENPDIPILHSDATHLPLQDEAYDIIIAIELLRYIPDRIRAIQEMFRVLKKGGICFVTVAPLLSTHGYAGFNFLNSKLMLPGFSNLRQYFETTHSITKKFKIAGFNDIKVEACFYGPFLWLGKILPKNMFAKILRIYEPIDDFFSRFPFLRNFANHMIVIATK